MTPAARMLKSALAYAAMGWPVFPCGYGHKRPACKHGFKEATTDEAQIRAWFGGQTPYNIGVATGGEAGPFVLDVDVKEKDGFAALGERDVPFTPFQRTGEYSGRRGVQYFFHASGDTHRNTAGRLGDGLDTRGDGGFVIVAPSRHPSGVEYEWDAEARPSKIPLAPIPDWILEGLKKPDVAISQIASAARPEALSDRYADAALQSEYDRIAGAAPGGRNHAINAGAFSMGQLVAAGVIPRGDAEVMLRNAALANGWAQEEGVPAADAVIKSGLDAGMAKPREIKQREPIRLSGRAKPRLAAANGVAVRRAPAEADDAAAPSGGDGDDSLILDGNGRPKALLINGVVLLRRELAGLFVYDDFAERVFITRRPPWALNGFEPCFLQDGFIAGCRTWLERHGVALKMSDTAAAIELVAAENHIHPVRDWLRALQWDGVERIDRWLSDYMGADESAFAAAVGSKFMIGAVARIMRPGCKMDTMLVLEGDQGVGKSSAVHALFGEQWTRVGAQLFDQHNKMVLGMTGAWCVEIAELAAMKRADQEKIKALISTATDHVVPPYGRYIVEHKRQSVLFGTVNPNALGFWNGDDTGGRRYWPVRVNRLEVDALARDRDQLWAEALHWFDQGHPWWLTDDGVIAEAKEAQAARHMEHPWVDLLRSDATLMARSKLTTNDALSAFGVQSKDFSKANQMAAAEALKACGFQRAKQRDGRNTRWIWVREE